MSWDMWESGDTFPAILNRAHWLQACRVSRSGSCILGEEAPGTGYVGGWVGHGGGEKELSGPCVKLNLDSLVIFSVHRPLYWLNYRGSHINDKSKTLATSSVHECKREHFVSGILQTFSETSASHGDRNYVFVMGYLQFRACKPLHLTAVTIE